MKIDVISPNSYFKFFWSILTTIILINTIIYKTFEICFNYTNNSMLIYLIFNFLPIIIFIIDILITCNTSYYKKGYVHTSRKSIIKNYLFV